MKTSYTFYTSRTLARNASKVPGVAFKDHGPDANKGARWSTFSLLASKPTLKALTKRYSAPKVAAVGSKKSAAVSIISSMMSAGNTRKEILAKLVSDVGLTHPGASTYYANVRNKTEGWVA